MRSARTDLLHAKPVTLTPPCVLQGFVSSDEFLSIPELSINPLAKRLAFFYDGINFREFVILLAPYSPKASQEDKIRHLFAIWDVDGEQDGATGAEIERLSLWPACPRKGLLCSLHTSTPCSCVQAMASFPTRTWS